MATSTTAANANAMRSPLTARDFTHARAALHEYLPTSKKNLLTRIAAESARVRMICRR
jgi:hypothetical protein